MASRPERPSQLLHEQRARACCAGTSATTEVTTGTQRHPWSRFLKGRPRHPDACSPGWTHTHASHPPTRRIKHFLHLFLVPKDGGRVLVSQSFKAPCGVRTVSNNPEAGSSVLVVSWLRSWGAPCTQFMYPGRAVLPVGFLCRACPAYTLALTSVSDCRRSSANPKGRIITPRDGTDFRSPCCVTSGRAVKESVLTGTPSGGQMHRSPNQQ